MKIRSTWHETLFLDLGGRLVKVDPGEVVEVEEDHADLLEQNDGTKFVHADKAPSPKKAG